MTGLIRQDFLVAIFEEQKSTFEDILVDVAENQPAAPGNAAHPNAMTPRPHRGARFEPPPIWPNPIFRRYARARLRPQALSAALIITLIVAGFLFFLFRTLALYRGDMDIADAERAPLIPLLILQAIILFIMGTGQVAAGITAEADEGVLDYQRLSPHDSAGQGARVSVRPAGARVGSVSFDTAIYGMGAVARARCRWRPGCRSMSW